MEFVWQNPMFAKDADKLNFAGAIIMNFPFIEKPNTAVITCSHILDDKDPILYVSHDEDDGMWQFLCGADHDISDARIISLEEVFILDSTIGVLAEMPQGCAATRSNPCDDWIIEQR